MTESLIFYFFFFGTKAKIINNNGAARDIVSVIYNVLTIMMPKEILSKRDPGHFRRVYHPRCPFIFRSPSRIRNKIGGIGPCTRSPSQSKTVRYYVPTCLMANIGPLPLPRGKIPLKSVTTTVTPPPAHFRPRKPRE